MIKNITEFLSFLCENRRESSVFNSKLGMEDMAMEPSGQGLQKEPTQLLLLTGSMEDGEDGPGRPLCVTYRWRNAPRLHSEIPPPWLASVSSFPSSVQHANALPSSRHLYVIDRMRKIICFQIFPSTLIPFFRLAGSSA